MIFTLTFSKPEKLPNLHTGPKSYVYPFTIVDSALIGTSEERSQTRDHRVTIGISYQRFCGWYISEADLPNVLVEFGLHHIKSLIESHTFPSDYEIPYPMITTESHPESECRFGLPANQSRFGVPIEIEQPKKPMGFNCKPTK